MNESLRVKADSLSEYIGELYSIRQSIESMLREIVAEQENSEMRIDVYLAHLDGNDDERTIHLEKAYLSNGIFMFTDGDEVFLTDDLSTDEIRCIAEHFTDIIDGREKL